jgi:hypothetical protein
MNKRIPALILIREEKSVIFPSLTKFTAAAFNFGNPSMGCSDVSRDFEHPSAP